ncbi:hypothetical protein [Streptosporangium amethystogenes]|uniref:hypothetical protein n=1 Tax=Streptosporangium amethystogenes TaxID=2002 RepID=UPI0012FA865E|nr:hypothetical protein [Streptosporangium amethystogenes]
MKYRPAEFVATVTGDDSKDGDRDRAVATVASTDPMAGAGRRGIGGGRRSSPHS